MQAVRKHGQDCIGGAKLLKHLHKRDGEVEPLPQAPKGNEGLSWETARGHLTVGLLILA